MATHSKEGGLQSEVASRNGGEKITFRRSDRPGSLVVVTIGREETHVCAEVLLAAVRLVQIEEEEN